MNHTPPHGSGLAPLESHVEPRSGFPAALGGLMASRGSRWTERAGAIPEGDAPDPAVSAPSPERVSAPSPEPVSDPLPDPCLLSIHEVKSGVACPQKTYGDISGENRTLGIGQLPARLERYEKAHGRALEMAEFILGRAIDAETGREARQLVTQSVKLQECGHYLAYRHYFTIDQLKLHAASFCQLEKLCPFCALRRGAKLLRRYVERFVTVLDQRPDLVPCHVVTTVKNGPDLSERFNHHRNAMRRLLEQRKAAMQGKRSLTQAVRAVGGIGSYEFKRGEGTCGGGWHPHQHAVWFCDQVPDQGALSQEWKDLTGDSHVVHVEPLHCVTQDKITAEGLGRDCAEVFKYALKFSTMSLSDNWNAFEVLHRRRLVDPFGVLRGVEVDASLLDAPLEVEDAPFVDLVFTWQSGRYVRRPDWN